MKKKKKEPSRATNHLFVELPPSMRSSVMLAQEKGASNWLSCLPLKSHNFVLHKTAFRDAIALRYHWLPSACPTSCACGHSFTIEHALSCPKGGFPSLRHNEVRDLTANLLSEVCNNVVTEPHLQPLSGETLQYKTANRYDNARLDIAANGFWGGRFERSYFDVRIFNPSTPSNQSLHSAYRRHDKEKRCEYQQRVHEIENASFTPLIFTTTGGIGDAATQFYKRLANLFECKAQSFLWNSDGMAEM